MPQSDHWEFAFLLHNLELKKRFESEFMAHRRQTGATNSTPDWQCVWFFATHHHGDARTMEKRIKARGAECFLLDQHCLTRVAESAKQTSS